MEHICSDTYIYIYMCVYIFVFAVGVSLAQNNPIKVEPSRCLKHMFRFVCAESVQQKKLYLMCVYSYNYTYIYIHICVIFRISLFGDALRRISQKYA